MTDTVTPSEAEMLYDRQNHLRSLDLAVRVTQITLTEPRIQNDDITFLIRHCLCEPAFFAEAKEILHPRYFLPNENDILCLWQAMCANHPRAFTVEGLVSAIQDCLRNDPNILLSPYQVQELTGPHNRLTDWLATPTDHLDVDRARDILRRFLVQRAVLAPLVHYVNRSDLSHVPADVEPFLQHALEKYHSIDAAFIPPARSFGENWNEHESRLAMTRGRRLAGLETGLPQLDEKLLGLRGVTLLGAMPSVGKTALCLQIGLGVCQAHEFNDAVVVMFSLEMSKDELITRVKCMLSGLDWRTYTLGSPGHRDGGEVVFTPEHGHQIQQGIQRMVDLQIDRRLYILDRSDFGDDLTVARIYGRVNQIKRRLGARRALIIIDYVQLLATGNGVQSDLEADKRRVRVLQDVVTRSKTEANPTGDAVIAISEARKPVGTSETKRKNSWGQGLAELMGSARLGYAADTVLLYRRMTDDDVEQHYHIEGQQQINDHFEILDRNGISPVVLTVEKGRDGTTRGEIPMEFQYRRLTFRELERVRPQFPERAPPRNESAIGDRRRIGNGHSAPPGCTPVT